MLTEEQKKIVHDEFESGLAKKDRSERIAGARVQLNWSNLEEHSPFIASLMEDRRFYGVAQQLLGEDAVGLNSNSNACGTRVGTARQTGACSPCNMSRIPSPMKSGPV